MVEYLQGLLKSGETFTLDVYTVDGECYKRSGLVAVDAVGLVIDAEGHMYFPWSWVRMCTTEHA